MSTTSGPIDSPVQSAKPKFSSSAIAALILGIFGVVVLSPIFGIIGLVQTKDGKRRGRGLAVAGLALSMAWIVAGVAVFGYIKYRDRGTLDSDALSVGDCLKDLPGDGAKSIESSIGRVKTVPCDQPHLWEVFGVIQLPDGPNPPADVNTDARQNDCDPKLKAYAPRLADIERYDLYTIYPSADSWSAGSRSYICLYSPDKLSTGSIHT